jgi:hypothetical protein
MTIVVVYKTRQRWGITRQKRTTGGKDFTDIKFIFEQALLVEKWKSMFITTDEMVHTFRSIR